MGSEQAPQEAVDVADWLKDEEFAEYPEGAREKTLFYCPIPSPYQFLKGEHRYLFKRSSHRYPEQFWVEILAYRLGIQMGISVPPAFVAYDRKKNQSGALIEWFLESITLFADEVFIPGGDYCQRYISGFDRKKGTQHNLETAFQIFKDLKESYPSSNLDWKNYWAKVLAFDALIGNTDRHQDNWGIIEHHFKGNDLRSYKRIRFSPVFDNGTSMGHEISPAKFDFYSDNRLEMYIDRHR